MQNEVLGACWRSKSSKMERKTSKMEALVLSGGILWPTGDILGSEGGPGESQDQFLEPKPKIRQRIGVFAGSFFEVIVEGFWSQNWLFF